MTTMRVGGPARFFSRVTQIEELQSMVDFARAGGFPVFVLGSGSNIIISDDGFAGVVIKIDMDDIVFEDAGDKVRATVMAGMDWDTFVKKSVYKNLYGLENLSLIPGTVGAAPVQNIGAYGQEINEVVEWVEVFDTRTGNIKKLSNNECNFTYRDSIFKKEKDFIVLRVSFVLNMERGAEYKLQRY